MTEDLHLLALYENRKMMLTINYRVHKEKCGYPSSFVYAIANDVFPYFHNTHIPDEGIIDPYYDCYKIKHDEIDRILKYIDSEWVEKRLYSFYELEAHFGGRHMRITLICVLRYAYLDHRFDKELWGKISSMAPIEASSITSELRELDI